MASAESPAWSPTARAVIDVAPALLDWSASNPPASARRQLEAAVVHLPPGAVDFRRLARKTGDWVGLLILDGLLLVELRAGRARTGWLIGADDLICPWDMGEISLTRTLSWRVLHTVRVALLDHEFSIRAGGIPIVARALVRKTAHTTNWLLAKSVMLASPLVEERLLLAFALFGERWGTVNQEGVLVKLPLTHALLATLCGSRRPSVTLALHSLEASGLLRRTADGDWLLRRRCGEDLETVPSCWPQYVDALGLGYPERLSA
jgi:CRP-like cAMP-binding protein